MHVAWVLSGRMRILTRWLSRVQLTFFLLYLFIYLLIFFYNSSCLYIINKRHMYSYGANLMHVPQSDTIVNV